MASLPTEDQVFFVRKGLAGINKTIDVVGNGTFHSADTTLATYQATNAAKRVADTTHEDQRMLFTRHNRIFAALHGAGIIDNTQITAMNTTATFRSPFTTADPTLPATYDKGIGED